MRADFRGDRHMHGTSAQALEVMIAVQDGLWPPVDRDIDDLTRIVHAAATPAAGRIFLSLGAETGEAAGLSLNAVVASVAADLVQMAGRAGGWLDEAGDIVEGGKGVEPWRISQQRRLLDEFGRPALDPLEGVVVDAVRGSSLPDGMTLTLHRLEGSGLALAFNPVCALRMRAELLAAGRASGLLNEMGKPVVAMR